MALSFTGLGMHRAFAGTTNGLASWYGEEHRGKLMANGKRFNPDKFTAASWFYPLGSKVRITLASPSEPPRSVVVTITDRGPAKEYVRDGRIIDLSHATFKKLAPSYLGLVIVAVQPADQQPELSRALPAATIRSILTP
jgi:rare lipoprotein A